MHGKRFLLPDGAGGGKTMILKRFFRSTGFASRPVYEAIVAAARHPAPYVRWGVADSVDGRFEMIALHVYLVLERLKGGHDGFRQELVDEFFRDMDRSLREMGVGDLSVGKKVRKMAEMFYGRVAAYDRALEEGRPVLEQALARNVYPDGAPAEGLAALAGHVENLRAHLAAQDSASIVKGTIAFKEPAP